MATLDLQPVDIGTALDLQPLDAAALDLQPMDDSPEVHASAQQGSNPADLSRLTLSPYEKYSLAVARGATPETFSQAVPPSLNPDWDFVRATHGDDILAVPLAIGAKIAGSKDPEAAPFKPLLKLPKVAPEDMKLLPTWARKSATVVNQVNGTLEQFLTPEQIAQLPTLELKPVQARYLAQMAADSPELIQNIRDAQTPDDRLAAQTQLGIHLGMAALLAKGVSAKEIGKLPEKIPVEWRTIQPPEPPTPPAETFSEFGGEIKELPAEESSVQSPQSPVPETPETIQAQVDTTQNPDSPKAVTLVTPGASVPENHGLTQVETAEGTALVNPAKVDPAEAKAQLDAGNGGQLLGMSTEQKPEGATAVLQTKTAEGTPVQDEVVTPATLPAAALAGRRLAPDGTQELKSPAQVIAERRGPLSMIERKYLAEDVKARNPVLAETVHRAGEGFALPEGYQLQSDKFVYAEPAPVETSAARMARERREASASIREQRPEIKSVNEPVRSLPTDRPEPGVPVQTFERPHDILDDIEGTLGGVAIPEGEDFDYAREAFKELSQSKAADLSGSKLKRLFQGEAADTALDGLHREGLWRGVQTVDELMQRMIGAAKARVEWANEEKVTAKFKAPDTESTSNAKRYQELVDNAPFNMVLASADEPRRPGLNAKWLEANIGDLTLPGAPEVKIVQSVRDLPEKARIDAEARAARGRITRGFLSDDGKTAYLVADNIHDVPTGRKTYLEETLGHAGMEPLIKPQEEAKLFDLIQRGAPGEAQRIVRVYEHDLTTTAGRREFLGEFVAKASHWRLQKPRLWQSIVDVLRRAAYRVGWLRNIPPAQVLDAVMRGLARKGAARLAAKAAEAEEGRIQSGSSQGDASTPPRFSLAEENDQEMAPSKLAARALADPNVAPAVKAAIDPNYEVKPLPTTAAQANAILQERGLDGAIAEHNGNPNLPEDVRVALGALVDEHMRTQAAVARASGKTKLAEPWEQRQVDFFNGSFRPKGTELGRAVNAFKLFGANSAQTWLKEYSKALVDSVGNRFDRVKGAADNVIRTLRQANHEALTDLKNDTEAQVGARDAVDEAVKDSPAIHKAVVMEMAGPWSESPEIMRMAREQVRAKADDLLNRGPRPPGLTPPQHLRIILDDVSKRAAEIASSHYQGAEPGVILRDKLMQRLGLGEDAATRMAKRLDEEFTRQVKAASEKLDARIATVRAKQGELRQATRKLNAERRALAAANQTVREAAARAAQEATEQRVAETSGKRAAQKVQETAATRALDAANKTVREAAARTAKAENELRVKQAEMMKWSSVERTIHNELREWNEKLGQIVTRSPAERDAQGNLVVQRLLEQSGLTGPKADKFKALLENRWEALVTERKQKMLSQLISPAARNLLAKPGLADRIIKYSNLGAFEDTKVYDAIKEKLKLPAYDAAVAREITRRANELQTRPRGSLQQAKGAEDLLAYIAKQRGMNLWEMAQSYWYANLLSGLTTQAKVAIYNLSSIGAHTFTQMVQHPTAIPQIVEALGRAIPKGVDTAGVVLRDGTVPGIGIKMFEHGHGIERWSGTAGKIAWPWKVMLRSLGAQHLVLFKPAAEIKALILAREMAKTEGAANTAGRAREILGWTEMARGKAEAQAEAEGLKGLDYRRRVQEILEQARPPELQAAAMEWAKRGTAVEEPYGVLGAATRGFDTAAKSAPILNLIVPFRRIVANVANDALGWTPLGWAERMWEYRRKGTMFGNKVNADQLADTHAQAIIGTVGLTAVAYAAANGIIGITAQGPATPEQRKTLHSTTGWVPYSIKVGGHYVSYMDRPGGIPLAIVGHYMDAMKYQKLDQEDALNRVAYATLGARSVILDSGWLQGLAGLFNQADSYTTKNASERIGTQFAKTASGFVPMSQMMKQIDRLFDPHVYDADGIRAKFLMQLPFVRKEGQPVLNRFGQPITSSPLDQFISKDKPDPIVSLLLAKKALPSDIGKGELTNDEYYLLVKRAGPMFYKALVQNAGDIAGKTPRDAKVLVETLSNQTTAEAKKAMGFDTVEKLRKGF